MSDLLSAIYDDIEDYKRLCKKYKEEPQFHDGTIECYGAHAKALEDREYNDNAPQREQREKELVAFYKKQKAEERAKQKAEERARNSRYTTVSFKDEVYSQNMWLADADHKADAWALLHYTINLLNNVLIYKHVAPNTHYKLIDCDGEDVIIVIDRERKEWANINKKDKLELSKLEKKNVSLDEFFAKE
jgi:hypothetical protein